MNIYTSTQVCKSIPTIHFNVACVSLQAELRTYEKSYQRNVVFQRYINRFFSKLAFLIFKGVNTYYVINILYFRYLLEIKKLYCTGT
jgi:hypothetical protein